MGRSEYILQMKNCRKVFPGVVALDGVSLYLKRGEVHALMGENGAGKSTIMKVLAGIYTLDEGELLLDSEPFSPKNPKDSLEKGISMVHQELNMLYDMTVEENLFLGRETHGPLGVVKRSQLRQRAQKEFDGLGIEIHVTDKVRGLSVAQMQMVEIVKATTYNADIIIMDEPTSAITDREVEKLFEIIGKLKAQNKAIVYISHKMEEIFRISDRITVLRDGRYVDSRPTAELNHDGLVRLMVGRELGDMYVKEPPKSPDFDPEEVVMEVQDLEGDGFSDISFQLRRGEILGIYGLMGAGRTEVVETIFGMRKKTGGTVRVGGRAAKIKSPKDSIALGMAFVPEDRKEYGLNLISSVRTNICEAYLNMLSRAKCLLYFNREKQMCDQYIKKLHISTASRDTAVGTLSGGNQQKVVLAKWLLGNPGIIIMDEPTRGIDIGAKAEIYKLMNDLAKEGKSIIMISSEMPELLGMSDRVVVLHNGRKKGEFTRKECAAEGSQEKLLACALAN